jgi:hypothetical protein
MRAVPRFKKDKAGRWRDERGRFANEAKVKRARTLARKRAEKRAQSKARAEQTERRKEQQRTAQRRRRTRKRAERRKREVEVPAAPPIGWIDVIPKLPREYSEEDFYRHVKRVARRTGMTVREVYTLFLSPPKAA